MELEVWLPLLVLYLALVGDLVERFVRSDVLFHAPALVSTRPFVVSCADPSA